MDLNHLKERISNLENSMTLMNEAIFRIGKAGEILSMCINKIEKERAEFDIVTKKIIDDIAEIRERQLPEKYNAS